MKKILYITNIEVPYKVKFFNELAKHCNLTVLYERRLSDNRNKNWSKSEQIKYNVEYLDGIKIGNEFSFSVKFLKYAVSKKYDSIIISCFNSPVQMMMSVFMKAFNKPYILSLDGEIFLNGPGVKSKLKRYFLSGAKKYLTAGEASAQSLRKIINTKEVIPYYFSSLTDSEIEEHILSAKEINRDNTVLVIGQYFDYKGMDIAFQAAKLSPSVKYKFVGMGERTKMFIDEQHTEAASNVEIIPFLQKKDLEQEYKKAALLVLPSRQECWGLVINEAASFGTPIVSTTGSGAAVEFLSGNYDKYLACPENAEELCSKILLALDDKQGYPEYSKYLIEKSREYSIQKMVIQHCKALDL